MKLKPEEYLWLEILLLNPELEQMEEERVWTFLQNLDFPPKLIEEYIEERKARKEAE